MTNANAWYSGTVTVGAVGAPYHSFAHWSGDVGGADTNAAELAVLMDRGRLLTAVFAANLATDRTPESWLAHYYGDTDDFDALALSDTDGDGMVAWREHKAGTSPIDGDDVLRIGAAVVRTGTDDFVIGWSTVSGRLYSVYSTTNLLAPWVTNLLLGPGDGLPRNYTNTPALGRRFFRVGVEQPAP